MNKYVKILLIILAILTLMFCEYRFIMHTQELEYGENNTVYSTVFGITDTYYVEPQDTTARIIDELYDAFSESELAEDYNIKRTDVYTISIE